MLEKNCTAPYLCCHTTLENSKVQISLKSHKWTPYDIDTKSQIKRLLSHCWMISVLINVTAFVQSVLCPHTSTKTATPLINCTVNDGLVHAVPNVHQTLLEFVSVVHQWLIHSLLDDALYLVVDWSNK